MNKTAIKNFAIWARNKLIASVEKKAMLVGITEAGIADKLPVSTSDTEFYDIGTGTPYSITGKEIQQRKKLVKAINDRTQNGDYKNAFHSVVEETAYTWFNRLIALRFMEVNNYLEDDMRVLSSVSAGKIEPDAVTTPFDYDFDFTAEERSLVMDLQANNKIDELFRIIFIKECNALNEWLPYLFEKTADYSEFLLTISVTDIDGVVYKLVHDIPEEDFNIEMGGQVEIIGWLYQYYNTEPKDIVNDRPSSQKVRKSDIPAITQLFTPDYIVRYMVENSLGRLWLEGHPSDSLKSNWIYYLDEAQQEPEVQAQLEELRKDRKNIQPEDIKIIDPCMGSGHILVYAFDVLMDIYREQGYVDREAAQSIIENNLYGLDIDQRAFQLAYFAVMMKGRQYDRRILGRGIEPNLCAIEESNGLEKYKDLPAEIMEEVQQLDVDDQFLIMADELIENFHDAKEYGSILNIPHCKYDEMLAYIDGLWGNQQNNIFFANWLGTLKDKLPQLVKQAKIMIACYDVVVTNPPYLGISNMNTDFIEHITSKYDSYKHDICCIFIKRCNEYLKISGYQAMITQQAFLFNSRYKSTRANIIRDLSFTSLLHLGAHAFDEISGEKVQVASFIATNQIDKYKSIFIDVTMPKSESDKIAEIKEKKCSDEYFKINIQSFEYVSDHCFSYWLSKNVFNILRSNKCLSNEVETRHGLVTGDIDKFTRLWFELCKDNIDYDDSFNRISKWYPYCKGGSFRRWYGNNEYVVNWLNNGEEIRKFCDSKGRLKSSNYNLEYNFLQNITWSDIRTSKGMYSARFSPKGFLFDSSGPALFVNDINNKNFILGYLNTKVFQQFINITCNGLHFSPGSVGKVPFYNRVQSNEIVNDLTTNNIYLSRVDWDAFETSWNFRYNPMYVVYHLGTPVLKSRSDSCSIVITNVDDLIDKNLFNCYQEYKFYTNKVFGVLKHNEEELNRIFIDIYGLQDELTPDVSDKDVTVASIFDTKEDIPESYKGNNYILTKEDVIKNLISYAVGCLFGRYSLKQEGLIYAGGDWSEIAADNWTEEDMARGIPDKDNVIPITDEAYLEDDLTGRFVRWLGDAFGTEHLEENLTFVADALNVKGGNSRDIIRNYFLNGFFADHFKKYQKRPIYWLYDSGKNNGFKALVYMHRYDADTTGRVRMDYLHRLEQIYGDEINRITVDIQESTVNKERAKLQKRLIKLQKQAKECREYDENIAHLALERIEIDLDDGVKVNYDKVQTDRNGKKYQILAKVKL